MKTVRKHPILRLCAVGILATLPACSVFMAANQPDKKDLSILVSGTPRSRILAEFGQPVSSRLVGNRRVDLFAITQGYSKEAKAGRAFAHGAADVVTGGIWELAGTPTEAVFSGKSMSYEITYDSFERVARVVRLSQ
ncbi:MAG: hypothetical protein WCL08_09340 [Verrucomicrobiota bacterium]